MQTTFLKTIATFCLIIATTFLSGLVSTQAASTAALEQTLSIIKPDGVQKNIIGEIIQRFEKANLRVVGAKMIQLTEAQAKAFYAVHKERPFYQDLVKYMTSGPIFVQVLEGENAISVNRTIMGATNPKEAKPGTIRADFATSIDKNVVHGSDAKETAYQEIRFFFKDNEIFKQNS